MSINHWLRYLCVLLLVGAAVGCASVQQPHPMEGSTSKLVSGTAEPATVVAHGPPLAAEELALSSNQTIAPIEASQPLGQRKEENDAAESVVSSGGTADEDQLIQRPSDASGPSSVYDPWEPLNRRIHSFNGVVDKAVARPVARAYVKVVPAAVRTRVANFFDNLGEPVTAVNALLQERARHSTEALGRFLLNSTVGVAGLFDPAGRFKMRKRDEDFGQTLAHWGWRRSRYLELPFLGPRTVRDVFGLMGDSPLQPLGRIEEDTVRVGLQAITLVDGRATMLTLDPLRQDAPDDYMLIRDSWMQRRNFLIEQDARADAALPDYLIYE